VVGISPGGNPDDVNIIDLSRESFTGGGALAEQFSASRMIDDLAITQKFFRDFPDRYDMVLVWTNFSSNQDGAFAFEITTRNNVQGIGVPRFNDTRFWGSSGNLQAYVFMGNIDNYPNSPDQRILRAGGRPTTLGLLSHEVGHRWLTSVQFDDNGSRSDALLGRQMAHWSFFMDTDASFLEGNDIEETGEGRFRVTRSISDGTGVSSGSAPVLLRGGWIRRDLLWGCDDQ
jgi:hypothetical protein